MDKIDIRKLKRLKRQKGKSVGGRKWREAIHKVDHARGITDKFDIKGVEKIILSDATQRAIGCIVNQTVSLEDPWIFVEKEKIEDNLEWHAESSEFLPIKDDILKYSHSHVLFGYRKPRVDEAQFYICTTLEAKEKILEILENDSKELKKKLKRFVYKSAGEWNSLGSEKEISSNILLNLRPLFGIEIDCVFPIFTDNRKFSFLFAGKSAGGYCEILPTRYSVENIFRRRIDKSTQVIDEKKSVESQTQRTILLNKSTYYEYEMKEINLSLFEYRKLKQFMNYQINNFCEKLLVNSSINIYRDDYTLLPNQKKRIPAVTAKRGQCYRDVFLCKNKKVSAVAWHPKIPDIIAAAYKIIPLNYIRSTSAEYTQVEETTFNSHFVLIWHYAESFRPKIILHSPREVNCLYFCPLDLNILVGGCTNGQIVIWDFINKLNELDNKEAVLNVQESTYHEMMHSFMKWIKKHTNKNDLFPTVVSKMEEGHRSDVTSICWLSADYRITKNGKLICQNDFSENVICGQFLTCGMDSIVCVWDLNDKLIELNKKLQSRRFSRPFALNSHLSPISGLNKVLIPIFKIIVSLSKLTRLPLTNMLIANFNSFNKDQNSTTTIQHVEAQPSLETIDEEDEVELKQQLYLTTSIGDVLSCTWLGHKYDQGGIVNLDYCDQICPFLQVHDGPIQIFEHNPFYDECLLTVGGRVFAIWGGANTCKPLFWRKSKVTYISGSWSAFYPFTVYMTRKDSLYEIWNFLLSTNIPIRIARFSYSPLVNIFYDPKQNNTKQNYFVSTDIYGAITLNDAPAARYDLREPYALKMIYLHKGIEYRREYYKNWLEKWKHKYYRKETISVKPSISSFAQKFDLNETKFVNVPKKSSIKTPPTNPWEESQQKYMYEMLLQREKIDIIKVELKRQEIDELTNLEIRKQQKVLETLSKKDEIFQSCKNHLLKGEIVQKHILNSISIQEGKTLLKEKYLNDYKNVEKDALNEVKCNPFRCKFYWQEILYREKVRNSLVKFKLQHAHNIALSSHANVKNVIKPRK